MNRHFRKAVISSVLAIILVLSIMPVNTAASVDIVAGGADISDPVSIFNAFAGYLDDIYIEDYNKMAEGEIQDVPGNIRDGVYIGDVNVSGMTYRQALSAVDDYVSSLSEKTITLQSINDNTVSVTAGDLGINWDNKDVAIEAVNIGKGGNLISQYKTICDLKQNPRVLDLNLSFDRARATEIIDAEAEKSNIRPTNARIDRVDGKFVIQSQGQDGIIINVAKSVDEVMSALNDWDKSDITVALSTDVTKSEVDEAAFAEMTDILGSYTTSFKTSSADRSGNVKTGCNHINGTLLYPGEQFSAYDTISPFSTDNGYFMAGSYMNGMVVESLGGGICQVSSTLYNAVIRAELQVDERYPHSMIVTYVDLSSDAAISETSGKDFKFTNTTDYPIYIEGYTTEDKKITFNIYGKDTRPEGRTIEFDSVETSRTEPVGEKIIGDPGQPVGFISTQSAHIGYTGELWKVVKQDGQEVERVQLNKSKYNPSPRTATVGTAAADANVTATINAAIATGSIDYCKQTIAGLTAAAQAALLGQ